jgi:hypothetical protein
MYPYIKADLNLKNNMSNTVRQIQTCSYCDTAGHKADKCSCPSLMELFVRTIEFVQSTTTLHPSLAEQTAVWLNTHNHKKVQVLARNLKLTRTMAASYNEARTSLIGHIIERRFSYDEVEFANRVSFRVGEGSEVMVAYRRVPQPTLQSPRASARLAVQDTRSFISGMSEEDIRTFLFELNIVRGTQETTDEMERFMEIYSGRRFQTGNGVIARYYVDMVAHMIIQLRRQPPWDTYFRERLREPNTQRRPQGQPFRLPPARPPQGQPPVRREIPQPIRNKANVIKVGAFVMPFECPICYEPVVGKCIVTTCGHNYCITCFEGVSNMFDRHTGNNTCSMCRGVLSSVVECSVVESSLSSSEAVGMVSKEEEEEVV